MIYFIQNQTSKAVKIGYTAGDAKSRLAQLQTSSADRLELLGWIEGEIDDEKFLHQRFASVRLVGEWFSPTRDLVLWVDWLTRRRAMSPIALPERQRVSAAPPVSAMPGARPIFVVGQPVIHPEFGRGRIEQIEGEGLLAKGWIVFANAGSKTLVLSKSRIKPLLKAEVFEQMEANWKKGKEDSEEDSEEDPNDVKMCLPKTHTES